MTFLASDPDKDNGMDNNVDTFETRLPLESLNTLLDLGRRYGFDPMASVELEEYFVRILSGFEGDKTCLREWLQPRIEDAFRRISDAPRWLQGANWQMSTERPMTFIGQVDVPCGAGIFHDDASFYLFFDPTTGQCKSLVQVA